MQHGACCMLLVLLLFDVAVDCICCKGFRGCRHRQCLAHILVHSALHTGFLSIQHAMRIRQNIRFACALRSDLFVEPALRASFATPSAPAFYHPPAPPSLPAAFRHRPRHPPSTPRPRRWQPALAPAFYHPFDPIVLWNHNAVHFWYCRWSSLIARLLGRAGWPPPKVLQKFDCLLGRRSEGGPKTLRCFLYGSVMDDRVPRGILNGTPNRFGDTSTSKLHTRAISKLSTDWSAIH
jgi:hypothetical protein